MKRNKAWILLLLAATLLCSLLIGGAVGKYLTRVPVRGQVTFTAKLAENVTLLEHAVIQDNTGKCTLNMNETTHVNNYLIIPGLDIPKDPWITVEGKTPLKAYLFLEVVETDSVSGDPDSASVITYSLEDHWMKLNGVTGQNNGTVYVYAEDSNPKLLDHNNAPDAFTVTILKSNTVQVSHKLITQCNEDPVLNFYTVLKEYIDDQTPAEIYNVIK